MLSREHAPGRCSLACRCFQHQVFRTLQEARSLHLYWPIGLLVSDSSPKKKGLLESKFLGICFFAPSHSFRMISANHRDLPTPRSASKTLILKVLLTFLTENLGVWEVVFLGNTLLVAGSTGAQWPSLASGTHSRTFHVGLSDCLSKRCQILQYGKTRALACQTCRSSLFMSTHIYPITLDLTKAPKEGGKVKESPNSVLQTVVTFVSGLGTFFDRGVPGAFPPGHHGCATSSFRESNPPSNSVEGWKPLASAFDFEQNNTLMIPPTRIVSIFQGTNSVTGNAYGNKTLKKHKAHQGSMVFSSESHS